MNKILTKKVTNHHKTRMIFYLSVLILIFCIGIFSVSIKYPSDEHLDNQPYKPATKVAAIGDIACSYLKFQQSKANNQSDCKHVEVFQKIATAKPAAVLLLGDLQYDNGKASDFENVFIPAWLQTGLVGYSAVGNHEYNTTNAQDYYAKLEGTSIATGALGKGYYKVTVGDWDVFVLNSNCEFIGGCNEGSEQYKWLKNELSVSTSKCSLAMWHHPVFTSGLYKNDVTSTGRMRNVWKMISEYNVDVVLNGHDHIYERFGSIDSNGTASINAPREFVVGTGGKSLYDIAATKTPGSEYITSTYGYLSLNLASNSYGWQFTSIDGIIKDSCKQRCH